MGAPNGFDSKNGRKINQNLPNFFFQKIHHKKSSETQFHQKRTKTRDFNLITARHEKFTAPENGLNSRRFWFVTHSDSKPWFSSEV
tara:strand:+ start:151 stop:408 length:258 start_codon:yes stop_codon:yes gene_type:complete